MKAACSFLASSFLARKGRCLLAGAALLVISPVAPLPLQAAGIAGKDLPDMRAVRSVFGDIVSGRQASEVETDAAGLIGSGIAVPDTGARGQMARLLSVSLAETAGKPEIAKGLETAFRQGVEELENQLPEFGFQKRDYGVAFALFFISTWETANETQLSPELYKPVAGKLIAALRAAHEASDEQIEDAGLDAQYDMFLTLPIVFMVMTQSFEAAGQPDAAAQMREIAGQNFEQIIGLSPYDIDISDEGRIIGYE